MVPDIHTKDIAKCCRTCLDEHSSDMYDIFQESYSAQTIAQMLWICTSLTVDKEDSLPKKLCGACYNCLVSFYEFRSKVEKVECKLRNFLGVRKESDLFLKEEIEIKVESSEVENNTDHITDFEDIKEEQSDIFTTQASQMINVSLLKPEVKFKCSICDKTFRKITKYEAHKAKHNKKSYVCSYCNEVFTQKYKLMKHLVVHRESKNDDILKSDQNEAANLQCSKCTSSFKSAHSLSAHMRIHVNKGRILACTHCKKIFKKMSHLKRHELSHDVNRPFKCSVCPKSFTTEVLLSEHTNRHFGIKPHPCPLCKRGFSNISSLTTHIKVHTKEKAYLCSTCGKKFDSSTNLNQHMKRHLGLKLFACSLCPKSFVSKGELKSHSITHTGEKFYSCECGASFTKSSSLEKHKLRHLGIRPYVCETCSMKFSSKDHLKRHYRIHTGEKPYRCELCDRAFTQSNDLAKHRRAHLGDKLYRCTQCTESFRLKTELRQHLSEHFISSKLQAMNVNENPQTARVQDKTESAVKEAIDSDVNMTSGEDLKRGDALVTPLALRVSMEDGSCLPPSEKSARLPPIT